MPLLAVSTDFNVVELITLILVILVFLFGFYWFRR